MSEEWGSGLVDYPKMRYEAGWTGFKKKNYSLMIEYLQLRSSSELVNYFVNQTKKYRRCFCARIVYYFHPNREYQKQAEAYYKKHRKEFDL